MDDAPLDAARSFAISDGAHQIDKKRAARCGGYGPGGGLRGLGGGEEEEEEERRVGEQSLSRKEGAVGWGSRVYR